MVATPSSLAPSVGSLVHVRGRDWVVLPSQDTEVLNLRPLSGDRETTGIFLPLEGGNVRPSAFDPPDPALAGDATGAMLLFDAARLSLRSGAAPFRSLSRIAVTPRPYQFVPLIMALRLPRVRLLIADDVGVGKTLEAALIARELLDRGLARRLCVLCPAHLCEQWEKELREMTGIETAIIQPSRLARLERDLPRGDLSVYQHYRHLVASIDFIKSDRNRDPFLRHAPDLIIVDEAHMAARPPGDRDRVGQQRYELVRELAKDPDRQILLVTATPHSGIEESFRSLLGLLDPSFDTAGELDRGRLLPHAVQRRRRDLARWLGVDTPFPERDSSERPYALSPAYHALFDDVLAFCRESIGGAAGLRAQQQRVRHWAAIAILRCVLSSPDAAVAMLTARAKRQGLGDLAEEAEVPAAAIDERYRPQVLDTVEQENVGDYVPTAPLEDAEPDLNEPERRRIAGFLRRARELSGPEQDRKLAETAGALGELLRDGFRPIVFCRFIATAKYLETWLAKLLGGKFRDLHVAAVTGDDPDEDRRAKVAELATAAVRVLVATDCLSEGINLQQQFDAVLHYDLPWNPNRLEQREGRVDRFGQPKSLVKTVLLSGVDNPVDLVVLDVLVRKARMIRQQLGVAVPVPGDSELVVQAVVDSVLLSGASRGPQLGLGLMDPDVSRLHTEWDRAAEREQRQRAYFAQHGISPDEVAAEMQAADPVLGDSEAVRRFLVNATQRLGGELRPAKEVGAFDLVPGDLEGRLREHGFSGPAIRVAFDAAAGRSLPLLGRTNPIVATYCDAVLGGALGEHPDQRFPRCGAIVTSAVSRRTAVLLLRLRYLLREAVEEFAEEVMLVAFERRDGKLEWLQPFDTAAPTLVEQATPVANLTSGERAEHVRWALDLIENSEDWFAPLVESRKRAIEAAQSRLRKLVRAAPLTVTPHKPPDILGCYVLTPAGGQTP